jgi:hypothetical protein
MFLKYIFYFKIKKLLFLSFIFQDNNQTGNPLIYSILIF